MAAFEVDSSNSSIENRLAKDGCIATRPSLLWRATRLAVRTTMKLNSQSVSTPGLRKIMSISGRGGTFASVLVFVLAFSAVNIAEAEEFIFETQMARLTIGADGVARSLIDKQNGKERLLSAGLAFAAIKKGSRLYPASEVTRHGALFHVAFGASGVSADYRITASAEYVVVELVDVQGDGIEEIRLMQLNVSLANAGGVLGVRWDDEFALTLMGLSERVDSRVTGPAILASVYPGMAMVGERAAIIASPTSRFLDVVQKVERDFRLPSPTLGGKWAKRSEDVRTSYLFTDITEANADETIRYAKIGGFRYILVYSGTWSMSMGSYPINTNSFPHGEEGLKAVIDKCHAAGLKVGMHMLTSFVGKNDPLVRPKPSPWLLKDADARLATDVSAKETQLSTESALAGFAIEDGYYGAAKDFQIQDEIIQCGQVKGVALLQCVRGFAGTQPAPHRAGATIYHVAERSGTYLADLKTPLKDGISDRVAGVINRCGFDMVYFDGGEINSANGPSWYWVGQQQEQIWEKSKRDLLVQGSGMTAWTWHIFSRGTCDDYAAVGVKEYLNYHKIADSWKMYDYNFLPADLGWMGFLEDAPDHPATTPDEVEYYAVRMLALDSAISLETNLNALKANGRTEEMLTLLGGYEQLRLSGSVPKSVRQQLASGEWHMTRPGEFHPIHYDAQRVSVPTEITFKNHFDEQTLKFRLQVAPELAPLDGSSNLPLLRAAPPVEIQPPGTKDAMPGVLVQRIEFTRAEPRQSGVFMVGPATPRDKSAHSGRDLTSHRAMAVRLEVEGPPTDPGESPVLNVQLEAGGKRYRDYYMDLDFRGAKSVILPEPGTNRILAEFRPAPANYAFKAAMYGFNYGNVVAVNLRWMRYPQKGGVRCRIVLIDALEERNTTLRNLDISVGSLSITIPGPLETGDYVEYWGDGTIRVFDRNGGVLSTAAVKHGPQLSPGENKLILKAAGNGNVVFTAITLGK